VDRYLPGNYELAAEVHDADGEPFALVRGEDCAGWTLDGYVIPRLASGLIWAHEISGADGQGLLAQRS